MSETDVKVLLAFLALAIVCGLAWAQMPYEEGAAE